MEVLNYTEQRFRTERGFQFAAKAWGNPNAKPVLALHGWLDNANTFDKIAPFLSEEFYVLAIDLPGHGLSDHFEPGNRYYLWEHALQVLELVEIIGWKKFSIVAHSLGTGIASLIAGSFPSIVDQLVCIDGLGAPFVIDDNAVVTNFRISIKQLKIARKTNFFDFLDPDEPKFRTEEEAIMDRMNTVIGSISYEASKVLTKRGLRKVKNGYRWRHDPMVQLTKPFQLTEKQAKQFIKNMTCRILLLLGSEGMFSDGLYKDRIRKFQKATVYWLPGGHHLHLEKASSQISTQINQFLHHKL